MELGEFDIKYKPCGAIKAQALSDFIVECTVPEDPPQLVLSEIVDPWLFYVDGSSKVDGSGAGLILISPEKFVIEYALRFDFHVCLSPREADYALREVHEGICGQHLGGRSLAHKILRQGYYWLGMQKDAVSFTRKCDQCQKFALISHMPAIPLNILTSPIPFAMWGMDILGPFPMATGLAINLRFTSVAHPQSNGQTENMNRSVLQGLKRKLDEAKGAWVDELPNVLWAYRTTPHSVTRETPFLLCFGTEALLPVEVGLPTV
ncbi:hypothetical protein RJ639_011482 [Escallonia herrerae]|uniref:Integrase zinc-binding domain-containing protein n=1 Tax=Escallonia herrerae TaxID=1293975 RepID=A0AA88VJJ9_9ASTE|nr:hypothetical protein RJ639_011482 [Escallonia herrerae]